MSNYSCAICGEQNYTTSYMPGCAEKQRMDRDGICFGCALWELRTECGCDTVIDGAVYSPGSRTSGPMRGMAGRRFDIEYFDGRRITTYDLWCGGVIPGRWRDRMPDTARFINGAERHQVGEAMCFAESDESTPAYPLPHQQQSKPNTAR